MFWGLDFSTRAASIGWVTADASSRGVVTAIWDHTLPPPQRLSVAYQAVLELSSELALEHPAVFVYVEHPIGKLSPQLMFMSGVLQMAIFEALFTQWHKVVQIDQVGVPRWKSNVLGPGRHDKPKKDDDFEYDAIKWCRENDVEVDDDNEADAICIAEHARLSVVFV